MPKITKSQEKFEKFHENFRNSGFTFLTNSPSISLIKIQDLEDQKIKMGGIDRFSFTRKSEKNHLRSRFGHYLKASQFSDCKELIPSISETI